MILGPSRGLDPAEERVLQVAGDAMVLLDDGKGRRFSVRQGKLADVPVRSTVQVRLTADQQRVTLLRTEGPALSVRIRSVDVTNRTVQFAMFVARDQEPEEKTLPVAQDARIVLDGSEGKLSDLKGTDDGPFAMLRLSLDQKVVQGIYTARGRN